MPHDIAPALALQPWLKLAQSNMELFARFASSPEVASEATRAMQGIVEQSWVSAAALGQSRAVAELTQGLIRNYTEFVTELGQSAYALMGQAQVTLLQHTQEAASNVIDAGTARAGRARHAA
jgi:hypothetical protein